MLKGLMQWHDLRISALIRHAALWHGDTAVVSCNAAGDTQRSCWAEVEARSRQVAAALKALELPPGTRVATLAWNNLRHLELYYGVSGQGLVLHTLNPRLPIDQLVDIVRHADDRVLAFDPVLLPLVRRIAADCPGVQHWVVLGDAAELATVGAVLPQAIGYEAWIGAVAPLADWPELDENTASSLCYTSGSSGAPKGVLYSHRSTVLHAWAAALPDARNVSARDAVLPAVPMFHANAWGLPYAAALVGCKLVLPGPKLDGASLFALMDHEGVSLGAGVPTLWLGLLQAMRERGAAPKGLARLMIGGSAPSPALLRALIEEWGIDARQGWGMTELSPLGLVNAPKSRQAALTPRERAQHQGKQGRPVFGVELRRVDESGAELGADAPEVGELQARGHWVAADYFEADAPSPLRDGWLPTGDLGTVDADGFVQLSDRRGDAIKSGGEWIASIALDAIAQEHGAVELAAVVAMPDPKWGERPLLLVQLRAGAAVDAQALLGLYDGRVPRWWIPDAVRFVPTLPLGPTGKVNKLALRRQLTQELGERG